LELAPCPGCAAAGIAQANASKATNTATFSAWIDASNNLTSFSRFVAMTTEMDLPIWEGQAITGIRQLRHRRCRQQGQRHQISNVLREFRGMIPHRTSAPNARVSIAAEGHQRDGAPPARMS